MEKADVRSCCASFLCHLSATGQPCRQLPTCSLVSLRPAKYLLSSLFLVFFPPFFHPVLKTPENQDHHHMFLCTNGASTQMSTQTLIFRSVGAQIATPLRQQAVSLRSDGNGWGIQPLCPFCTLGQPLTTQTCSPLHFPRRRQELRIPLMRSLEMGCLEQGEPRAPHPSSLHPTSRRAAPELGLPGLGGH